MTAIREFLKVKNHKIEINLPKDFNYDEVEVVIIPKTEDNFEYWSDEELAHIGKIGLHSSMFENDEEDYSQW